MSGHTSISQHCQVAIDEATGTCRTTRLVRSVRSPTLLKHRRLIVRREHRSHGRFYDHQHKNSCSLRQLPHNGAPYFQEYFSVVSSRQSTCIPLFSPLTFANSTIFLQNVVVCCPIIHFLALYRWTSWNGGRKLCHIHHQMSLPQPGNSHWMV